MFLTTLFDRFGWTRDDAKWICGVIAAVVIGLATLSDSAAAAFAIPAGALPYIRLGAFIVGIISANYKTSGLPGKAILLACVLGGALILPACGNASVHLATTVDTTIVNALHQVYVDEQAAYKAGLYSKAKHDGYLTTIKSADQDALALTDAIDAWRVAGANPKSVPAIVATAKAGLESVRNDLSALPANHPLIVALNAAISFLS